MGIRKEEKIPYYSPEKLIEFYKSQRQVNDLKLETRKVNDLKLETLTKNCMRYEYGPAEISRVCDELGLDKSAYRKIRNEVYDSLNPLVIAARGKEKLDEEKRIEAAWQHIKSLHFRNELFGSIMFSSSKIKDGKTAGMWEYPILKRDLTKEMVARLLLVPNLYIAVNTSKSHLRTKKEINSINAFYLDIDNVKDADKFIQKCKVEGRFDVLEPSKIIKSGGGLHVYFYLKDVYSNNKLNRYLFLIQDALRELYPEADTPRDITRLLRLDGSIYAKPGKKIKIVETIFESNQVYEVEEIGPKLVTSPPKKKSKKRRMGPGLVPDRNWKTLEEKRLRDMEYLLKIGHFDKDRRKKAVWIYALFILRFTGRVEVANEEAYNFNASLKMPLDREVVKNQISGVLKNGFNYTYRRETLVDLLEIGKLTKEEQSNLKALMPKAIKLERDKAYKKKMRRNKNGLTKRETAAKKNYNKVASLLEQGLKQKDIALETGLSKSRVSEIVKQIKNENK